MKHFRITFDSGSTVTISAKDLVTHIAKYQDEHGANSLADVLRAIEALEHQGVLVVTQ